MRAFLDHAVATPLDPRVRAAVRPFLDGEFASPSALYEEARAPAAALERAREHVARLIGGQPEEIVFTSGATEARNLGVKGIAAANRALGERIVTTAVEHPATLAAAHTVTRASGEVVTTGVDPECRVDPDELGALVDDATALVAISHGQADVGTLQDLDAQIAAVRRRSEDVRVLVDAAPTAGMVPLDVRGLDADAVVLGGPALGAPAWSAALWVRPGTRIHPIIEGGVQEAGKRAGDPSLPAAVALGAAAELARTEMAGRAPALASSTRRLVDGLLSHPGVRLNGPREGRIPGYAHICVPGVEGESLTLALAARGVAVSPGSACTVHAGKESPVLVAMGLEAPLTLSAVLFSAHWATTVDEIDAALSSFADAIQALRAISTVRA